MKRVFIIAISLLASPCFFIPLAQAQTELTEEQKEEARQKLNKAIEQRVVRILEKIEMTDEQLQPMQVALIQFCAPMQIEPAKTQAERKKMQASGDGRQNMDRQAMMQRRQKMEKLRSDTDKKVKAILDKKQYKDYLAAMEEMMPQRRRGPGGGGPGGGARGGR